MAAGPPRPRSDPGNSFGFHSKMRSSTFDARKITCRKCNRALLYVIEVESGASGEFPAAPLVSFGTVNHRCCAISASPNHFANSGKCKMCYYSCSRSKSGRAGAPARRPDWTFPYRPLAKIVRAKNSTRRKIIRANATPPASQESRMSVEIKIVRAEK